MQKKTIVRTNNWQIPTWQIDWRHFYVDFPKSVFCLTSKLLRTCCAQQHFLSYYLEAHFTRERTRTPLVDWMVIVISFLISQLSRDCGTIVSATMWPTFRFSKTRLSALLSHCCVHLSPSSVVFLARRRDNSLMEEQLDGAASACAQLLRCRLYRLSQRHFLRSSYCFTPSVRYLLSSRHTLRITRRQLYIENRRRLIVLIN